MDNMQQSPVKTYSNKDYKKLGDRIREDSNNISETDYEMLQYLRTSYKLPLASVFNSLEALAHKVDENCVCTYRIKRIESIISKLIRFPEMQVNRAEDIAGCRCILTSEKQVFELYNLIKKKISKLPFEIKGKVNDYITNPKESGYKSIHLNVTLHGDNRRIEIQLRCLDHHNWATLVEITDLLYSLKIKENGIKSNADLFRLHLLLSKSPDDLSSKELNDITDVVINYEYLQRLGTVFANNYVNVRKHWNSLKLQSKHFFLISTSKEGTPDIQGFSKFDEAEEQYFERFITNKENRNIVLTHLHNTSFAKISIAYSNYFLTFNNAVLKILYILSKAVESAYKHNHLLKFNKYYQAFLDLMLFWMEKQIIDINSFQQDNVNLKSKRKQAEWAMSIQSGIKLFNIMFQQTQIKLKFRGWNTIMFIAMRSKYNKFKVMAEDMSRTSPS